MRRRRPIPTIALLAVLAAASCAPDAAPPPGTAGRYTSGGYGISFEYPDSLALREYVPEHVALGREQGDGFAAAVEVVVDSGEGANFRTVATDRAMQACAADGPDRSLQCVAAQLLQPFETADGVEGIVFYLRHLTTRPGTDEVLEVGARGPVFALPLPGGEGGLQRVLFVRAPVALTAEQADSTLIREVATSVITLP